MASASPTPVSDSTSPKKPPAPTTSRIMPSGRSARPVSAESSARLVPRRVPSSQKASSTAMVNATVGLPRNVSTASGVLDAGSARPPNVAPRISSIGSPMTSRTVPSFGSGALPELSVLAFSVLSSSGSPALSGTGRWMRLPIQFAYSRPQASAGRPQARPNTITQPRSTPSSPAATTGPGCGGRKACVMDSAPTSGRQYSRIERPPCRAATYTSGALSLIHI